MLVSKGVEMGVDVNVVSSGWIVGGVVGLGLGSGRELCCSAISSGVRSDGNSSLLSWDEV